VRPVRAQKTGARCSRAVDQQGTRWGSAIDRAIRQLAAAGVHARSSRLHAPATTAGRFPAWLFFGLLSRICG
jgi:hypothetical protein